MKDMLGETTGAMKPNEASTRLGKIIVAEVAKLPALQALAIFFETGQGAPVFYFAYETVEHALKRLNDFADTKIAEMRTHRNDLATKGAQVDIDRIDSDLSALPFLHSSIIGDHCNGLLETGYWVNPAAPVLFEVDAVVDAWAHIAFGALDGEKSKEEWYAAHREITDTFWRAIDVARMASPAWPPIAFVASFDDSNGDIARAIGTRHAGP
jgi:hypothetical protein